VPTAIRDAELESVFGEMIRRGLHHVPVVDGDKAVGMLTPIDVLVHQKSEISFENQELMRYVSGSY
jgi:CBS domain-containing protein